jgi:nucleoside-diphosphate-sugar epimerase
MNAPGPSPQRVCAVTGAAGYVGSCIASALVRAGWGVVPLGRHEGQVRYSLEEGLAEGALASRGVTALVHCAYDFAVRGGDRIHAVNVEGTRRLFETARAEGVRQLVLISSTAAFEGCRSLYGRAKLETEGIAASFGAFIVRPGLVCGRQPGGMAGTIVKLLRRFPVVPMIGSGRTPVHTVHEDDLGLLIAHLLDVPATDALRGAPIVAANEDAIEFREMLRQIAAREGRPVVLAPVPWPIVWLGVRALEMVHAGTGLRSDSVVSFVNANPRPDFTNTRRTGVTFRPYSVSAEVAS